MTNAEGNRRYLDMTNTVIQQHKNAEDWRKRAITAENVDEVCRELKAQMEFLRSGDDILKREQKAAEDMKCPLSLRGEETTSLSPNGRQIE